MPKVRLNDVEIYYEEHGQGQPMVFLSETACDGEVWKINQVPEFSRDHRVIIHDYRGTGQSSKPSIDYTTRMFADDEEHRRARNLPAIVAGLNDLKLHAETAIKSGALLLVLGSFIYFAHFSGAPPGSTYVPAHMEDGKFVPGTTK